MNRSSLHLPHAPHKEEPLLALFVDQPFLAGVAPLVKAGEPSGVTAHLLGWVGTLIGEDSVAQGRRKINGREKVRADVDVLVSTLPISFVYSKYCVFPV